MTSEWVQHRRRAWIRRLADLRYFLEAVLVLAACLEADLPYKLL